MAEIGKIIEWLAEEGFTYDGIKLWKQQQYALYEKKFLYYTTEEVLALYERNGRKRVNPRTG